MPGFLLQSAPLRLCYDEAITKLCFAKHLIHRRRKHCSCGGSMEYYCETCKDVETARAQDRYPG